MSKIEIVGLGPGAFGQLTVETLELLESETPNYFRTEVHPVVRDIEKRGIPFQSFDYLYENCNAFEEVYIKIADILVEKAKKDGNLVYAVPGNPLFGEQSVVNLIQKCVESGVEYHVYSGVSFVDISMTALETDPVEGLKVIDAFEIKTQVPDKNMGNLVTQVFNKHMASEIKLFLLDYYPPEFEVTLLINAGIVNDELIKKIPLCEIDWVDEINHLTTLYLPPFKEDIRDYHKLLAIMEKLRSKEGCPWDRKQTHESLKPYLLEETYEVIDAIETGDTDNLIEELGDLMFQIVFHAQLGSEEGLFTINDILEGINEKMIRRHPHVFMTPEAISTEEVVINWDEIKKEEKKTETLSDEMIMIPKAFTALMEAYKVQLKASKVGFDWNDPLMALEKVEEETIEVREEILNQDPKKLEMELGDLLFAVVNVARLAKIQPEVALRKATKKFIMRFKKMEKITLSKQKNMLDYNLEGLEILWKEVKTLKSKDF
ncbi:MAG: nucleoside triphosphate pyrophosphohydrolase [Eubacterium sp.]